jgi:hypothetical protein
MPKIGLAGAGTGGIPRPRGEAGLSAVRTCRGAATQLWTKARPGHLTGVPVCPVGGPDGADLTGSGCCLGRLLDRGTSAAAISQDCVRSGSGAASDIPHDADLARVGSAWGRGKNGGGAWGVWGNGRGENGGGAWAALQSACGISHDTLLSRAGGASASGSRRNGVGACGMVQSAADKSLPPPGAAAAAAAGGAAVVVQGNSTSMGTTEPRRLRDSLRSPERVNERTPFANPLHVRKHPSFSVLELPDFQCSVPSPPILPDPVPTPPPPKKRVVPLGQRPPLGPDHDVLQPMSGAS